MVMKKENIKNLEKKSVEEIIEWALLRFQNKIALASSFSAEDVVLIDMLVKIHSKLKIKGFKPRIFIIDTGRLPQETYNVIDKIIAQYKVEIDIYFPDEKSVKKMINKYGFNLFYKNTELRQLCCNVRKVEPLNRALTNLKAWICGLRREQSVTRINIKKVDIERRKINSKTRNIVKISPLADWTDNQLWDYIKKNNIPYNILYNKGFTSIGCAPCTRAIKKGEDVRAGRWWWEISEKKECGLHLS